jgi:phenylalanyl-tRNA synthetase alpha subunit
MSKKVLFDTLKHAKILESGGVEHADVHATALALALADNLYSKHETDNMIEAALKRFDDRTTQMLAEIRKEHETYRLYAENRFNQLHSDIKDFRLEVKDEINDVRAEISDVRIEMKDMQDNILKRGSTALAVVLAVIALSSSLLHFSH